mmetsp:Transcript_3963/g.5936  ORF Transcript_3963/g.5936 Transcript_3963/m.5936 type:complete len:169 (-) Transcript_3963:26-532(-)
MKAIKETSAAFEDLRGISEELRRAPVAASAPPTKKSSASALSRKKTNQQRSSAYDLSTFNILDLHERLKNKAGAQPSSAAAQPDGAINERSFVVRRRSSSVCSTTNLFERKLQHQVQENKKIQQSIDQLKQECEQMKALIEKAKEKHGTEIDRYLSTLGQREIKKVSQ